jgi:multisubunit Na+/H+ antiporter MnhC subunit
MLVGGVALGYEGITRLIKPEPVEAGLLSMLAGLASGIIAYMMGIYLGFVGKRTGNLSMVSQSLDSKNHVIIPTAVVVGIAFAAFGLSIVDSLVSVCVVTLILKSVEEIGAETYKSARGEEPNLSRFKAKWKTKVDNYRRGYIKFLTLLRLKTPMSIEELARELETTFSRKGDSYLKNSALNMREGFSFKKSGRIRLKELVDQGLIMLEDGKYHTTRKGNGRLRERLRQEKHKHQKS